METVDQKIERLQKLYLHTLITANLLLSLNDELANTSAYKQKLKSTLRQLQPELVRMVDRDLGAVWGTKGNDNDQSLYECMSQQEEFVKQVAQCSYADYGILAKMVELYNQNREEMMAACGISIERIGDIKIR